MNIGRTTLAVVGSFSLFACSLLGDGKGALAQANFYAGKQMTMVVGFSPGGGIDAYARLVARYLGRYIPGNPNIVVENMPGAASMKSVQYLETNAPNDGSTILAFFPGLVLDSIINPSPSAVDFSKFSWLGSPDEELRVCYVTPATGIKSWDDLRKRDVISMGASGTGAGSYLDESILKNIFGLKVKQVLGYPGDADKKLAVERGELDGDCVSWTDVPEETSGGQNVYVFLRFQEAVPPGRPTNVPYAFDLLKNDPDKLELLSLVYAPSKLGRSIIAPKGVPADRVAILRAAFDKAVKDPQLLADAEKEKLDIVPTSGGELQNMVADLYKTPPAIATLAKKLLGD